MEERQVEVERSLVFLIVREWQVSVLFIINLGGSIPAKKKVNIEKPHDD